MTLIWLNDDRSIQSIQYTDESASPVYVAHHDLKFVERPTVSEVSFETGARLQVKVLMVREKK